ncbi:MAG: hypothetical protein IK997_00330 [Bacilli bacterium]|nr:hypothetical protein [Bacilli bacterium]
MMNYSFNKKELKNISRKFRGCSNRILNSDFSEFNNNLKRFITLVDEEKIIKDYIISCINEKNNYDIDNELNIVCGSYGRSIFDSYIDEKEEISYTYQILKAITEKDIDFRSYSMGYAHSNQYQEMVKGFSERFILPFINYIDEYLERIFTEMGLDENNTYNITINGGQLNISKDNSTLNAIQNNNEISNLINELKNNIKNSDISEDLKNEITENADGLQEELNRQNPRKGILKSFAEGLKNNAKLLPKAIEISANIATIIQFVSPYIK